MPNSEGDTGPVSLLRAAYARQMIALRETFEITGDGLAACRNRSAAVDELVRGLWSAVQPDSAEVCLLALGGYGRQQLFPASDVDLLFCTGRRTADPLRAAIRQFSQALWDAGLKVAPATRALQDLEPFKPSDPEFSLALLDQRFLCGDPDMSRGVQTRLLERRSAREARALGSAAADLTRERHARFGHTLFHLEPNVKDAPGGLRDAHTAEWLARLRGAVPPETEAGLAEAFGFLASVRTFLHLRHGRDDNTLDWQAQDEAAARAVGLGWVPSRTRPAPDASSWMRAYFRHARRLAHELARELDRSGLQPKPARPVLKVKAPARSGFTVEAGVLDLAPAAPNDPARDPDVVLSAFALLSETGVTLSPGTEERIEAALPALSGNLEDGPRLWSRLRSILLHAHAGTALRSMHALGVLELILPEFHGIDALVIRDAYHRYTVDEHTFVLLDVLHGLAEEPPAGAPEWRLRFRSTLRELPQPDILYLAALLHDTGKGRAGDDHAAASAQLAEKVCARLELGAFETGQVVRLIDCHLEMSAALRRDIFDTESVRVFAEKVQTHDLLRMLTLFTYADISAVHPDALTPWKAENLWRLSMAAANQLDRHVDDERVHALGTRTARFAEGILRALGRSAPDRASLEGFLEGFPERYLRTRPPELIRLHMLAAQHPAEGPVLFRHGPVVSEVTVVTRDRPHLFTDLTAALAAWRMDVLTAEAFSNDTGCVVDTFRFTDTYRTLELNPEEHARFLQDLQRAVAGSAPPGHWERRQGARKRPRRVVETHIEFDNQASSHSTLFQVVAQNVPGLLHAVATALSGSACNVEVALIDTEGEMAIDVFYVTRAGNKLEDVVAEELVAALAHALLQNAGNRTLEA